jgi:hypothetical protein
MAEADLAGARYADPLDAVLAEIRAVGAARVLQQPLATVHPEDRVQPGHGLRVDHEIRPGVAADPVAESRLQCVVGSLDTDN